MDLALLGSKWILGCAAAGALFALGATQASAASKKDPEAKVAKRESRGEAVSRSILGLSMVDTFRTGHDAFLPPGQAKREARAKPEARNARGAGHGKADIDLGAIIGHRGGEGAPSSSPISSNPIPEPSSLILLAAGAGLVAWAARRKLAIA